MRKSPSDLLIPIQILGEGKKSFSFQESVVAFPVLAEMEERGEGVFVSPVEIHIDLWRADDIYCGEGTAATQAELICGRCLEKFLFPLKVEFTLAFSRFSVDKEDQSGAEERELAEEDVSLIPFAGDELDLREAVQDQLLMALPVRPLCREECLGLCPVCGADRNRESCGCPETAVNPKWAALAGLRIEDQENKES
ncbi:MAG: DUF177 domain-containing protein [Desulfuromonadaceae bacterium]|nr:DUF177 domain-containing protein [Desulfuromonadaceae bacterium]